MAERVVKVNPDDIEWNEKKPFTGVLYKELYKNEKTGQTFQLLTYKEGYVEPSGNGKLNSWYYGKQNSHGNGKQKSHKDGK